MQGAEARLGLEQRDYMTGGPSPGLKNRWDRLAISDQLIALNLFVWLLWQFPDLQGFMGRHATVSWEGLFQHGRVWTAITSSISHADLWHLVWNMVFLHWCGHELETIYGRRNFLVLYLYGALVTSLAHAAHAHLTGFDVPALGASGAVMGVVVVTAMFFPQRTIYFMWFLPLPLWLVASIKLVGDVAGIVGPGLDGVGHAGHLGGAAAGLAFKLLDLRLFPSPGQQEALERPWRGLGVARFLRWVLGANPPAAPTAVGPRVDGDTAMQVDDLLRKIHREGMDSLTPEELQFLRSASQRYKPVE